jgi:mitotic spindle assembly checkpoint protein MAD1
MEELREKVVKLEAEVVAGRREREARLVFFSHSVPKARLTFYRANRNSSESSSSTPVSIAKNLSNLRLAHARLLEEHRANIALLRQREAEFADLERQDNEMQLNIRALQPDVRSLKEKIGRREQRVLLAEREVGFLNGGACVFPFFYF